MLAKIIAPKEALEEAHLSIPLRSKLEFSFYEKQDSDNYPQKVVDAYNRLLSMNAAAYKMLRMTSYRGMLPREEMGEKGLIINCLFDWSTLYAYSDLGRYDMATTISINSALYHYKKQNLDKEDFLQKVLHAYLFSVPAREDWRTCLAAELERQYNWLHLLYLQEFSDDCCFDKRCALFREMHNLIIQYRNSLINHETDIIPELKNTLMGFNRYDKAHQTGYAAFPPYIHVINPGKPCQTNILAYGGKDAYGIRCLLVPSTKRTLAALRKIYNIPGADPLLPISSMGAVLCNPATSAFTDIVSQETGTIYVGQTNIGEWLGRPETEDEPDNMFYKFSMLVKRGRERTNY